jgi:predicted O-methyltransferase YrrM
MPSDVMEKYGSLCKIVTSAEKDFVFSTQEKYDFIMSDGDHDNTDKWFEHVYDNLLLDNGILVYHDVNMFENSFVNLRQIYERTKARNLSHHLFNKNSLKNERCQRGLLIIFKH